MLSQGTITSGSNHSSRRTGRMCNDECDLGWGGSISPMWTPKSLSSMVVCMSKCFDWRIRVTIRFWRQISWWGSWKELLRRNFHTQRQFPRLLLPGIFPPRPHIPRSICWMQRSPLRLSENNTLQEMWTNPHSPATCSCSNLVIQSHNKNRNQKWWSQESSSKPQRRSSRE